MPWVKEIVMHGFKSFARETKILFKPSMNVIVGPNGAGKSNITDAICFVLGRLGSKSMRAKRVSNLIFAGTQKYKPASEASVEMIFDNTDKEFSIDKKEVSIKRVLRKGWQGIYKINNEIRTRQEVVELMSQAGINPNGFNIILQGEIDSFVKMHPDERREVLEEVAGISIYEARKQRSLKELEKTETKLKEVAITLKERTIYLKNLEQERRQALRYKKLQSDVKDYRASIMHRIVSEKNARIEEINSQISRHKDEIDKLNALIDKNNQQILLLNEKIAHITNNIQKQSGIEQEELNNEISDLRADIAGLEIRKQGLESSVSETEKRKSEVEANISYLEQEIAEMKSAKGKKLNTRQELEQKKKQLDEIDRQRRRFYQLKSELSSFEPRIADKKSQIQRTANESDFVMSRIQETESQLKIKEGLEKQQENLAKLKPELERLKKNFGLAQQERVESEKTCAAVRLQINELDKTKTNISSYDICPLCKTKMTKEHISRVIEEIKEQQGKYQKELDRTSESTKKADSKISELNKEISRAESELLVRSQDALKLELINEKKQALRKLSEQQKQLEKEFSELETKKISLEKQVLSVRASEESYDSLGLELQELERREEKNAGMDVILKQRDIDRARLNIREAERGIEEDEVELEEVTGELEQKQDALHEKIEQNEAMKRHFKKTLDEKAQHQEKIRFFESDSMHKQNSKQMVGEKINNFKIQIAELDAQKRVAEQEQAAPEFTGAKIIRLSIEELKKRLESTQRTLDSIGIVNLRSLELYEGIKAEYDKIQEKANVLQKEKEEILKIIEDVDKKKRKVFIKTLGEINQLFSRNFSQLSTKGEATLEPTNTEDIFSGGIEMTIKVGKGKYFDTRSLSGGEQSLISLSLIFAIQEYRPYCFYIFDEIDAALDKRNSERLAALLKRYMKNGQYIIITHNDSLITEAPTIYGVVMQDKISSIFSIEV